MPGLVLPVAQLEVQQRTAFWPFRFADEGHVGLAWSPTPFANIAGDTGTNNIFPAADPSLASWDHMVQAEVGRGKLFAAILAQIAIASKDVSAIKLDGLPGDPVIVQ